MKMKSSIVIFFLFFILTADGQNIEQLKFDDIKKRVTIDNDTLYVLNFWATWCKPCIEELPAFEKCNSEFQKKKIKIILVNLDFNSKVQSLVEPFIEKKNLRSEIVHITDTDANSWINKADSSWSGAIPATIMYRSGKKQFFKEGSLEEEELRKELNFQLGVK